MNWLRASPTGHIHHITAMLPLEIIRHQRQLFWIQVSILESEFTIVAQYIAPYKIVVGCNALHLLLTHNLQPKCKYERAFFELFKSARHARVASVHDGF